LLEPAFTEVAEASKRYWPAAMSSIERVLSYQEKEFRPEQIEHYAVDVAVHPLPATVREKPAKYGK
jgi:hypothetical protein